MKKIIVYYVEDLDCLRHLPKGEYIVELANDLDFMDSRSYRYFSEFSLEKNMLPIDLYDKNVIFNGNNNSIFNLCIFQPEKDNIGFFNTYGDSTMVIKNLNISGMVVGNKNVGLLGGTYNGTISNCSITNTNVDGNLNVSAVVGKSDKELFLYDCDIKSITTNFRREKNFGLIVGKGKKVVVNSCEYEWNDKLLAGSCDELELREKSYKRKRQL